MTKLDAAIRYLRSRGATIETTDMPGLYRLNGGAEITVNQVFDVANRLGWTGN